jgi:hypothetical protein
MRRLYICRKPNITEPVIEILQKTTSPKTCDHVYHKLPQLPGSRGSLLTPSPLRTVRDSFPSHSSSPSKANLGIEVTRWSKISITFAIHTGSQNPFGEERMAHIKWPHLLSLLKSVQPAFSQRSTRWTSAPMRVG